MGHVNLGNFASFTIINKAYCSKYRKSMNKNENIPSTRDILNMYIFIRYAYSEEIKEENLITSQ